MSEYVIGPQDLLAISVLESPELARDIRVSIDGTVGLPLLRQRIRVSGLSLSQAEALVAKSYQDAGIFNNPNITITLKDMQSKPVTVTGAVQKPGIFQISGPTSLIRVITQAGGLADEAGTIAYISRGGRTEKEFVQEVKITDLQNGIPEANVQVEAGDVVNVPPAGGMYVLGAVNKPGRILLTGDQKELTVLRVLAMSADLARFSKADKSVILRPNYVTGEVDQIPVDISKILARKAPDVAVHANDVLFIPTSAGKRAMSRGLDVALQVATGSLVYGLR